ncbi:hypothetical protein HMPREF9622_00677 [Cutibacterium modestum HL037PA3]|jgi:transposase|nr:hypothetical protein HMPREF9621_01250 [Cutibacterium modestum HL037PA2]EFS91957.1 hypothetical protein HMPREF9607_01823 [Cutibacterium modestum HL044PA1]EFT16223.1 hypothetical protein HMPREF9622_00677 [Cutibacterium modestum HL037PA3]
MDPFPTIRLVGNALNLCRRRVQVEATWAVYQRMITPYRASTRAQGRETMISLIDSLGSASPTSLVEVCKLDRALTMRRGDVLAFFDHDESSNGPTEAINGRLEHFRETALGFRNLTHYIARSLLEADGFRP